jgi:hypothetical protein
MDLGTNHHQKLLSPLQTSGALFLKLEVAFSYCRAKNLLSWTKITSFYLFAYPSKLFFIACHLPISDAFDLPFL